MTKVHMYNRATTFDTIAEEEEPGTTSSAPAPEEDASAPAEPPSPWTEGDRLRAWERLKDAVLRGALAGLGVRGGLNVVSLAVSLLGRRGGRPGPSWSLVRSMALDTLRYAGFLGSYSGAVVAVDEGISAVIGKKRSAQWRALVAGLLAGPTLLLTGGARGSGGSGGQGKEGGGGGGPHQTAAPHTSLATYVLVRSLVLAVRMGNAGEGGSLLRSLLSPSRWAHGDTALMCVAAAQILYSFLLRPDTLPKSYIHFLGRHAGQPDYFYEGLRELVDRNATGHPPAPLRAFRGVAVKEDMDVKTTCDMLGPGHDCNAHFIDHVRRGWLRALPVYVPVYLLPAVLVHRSKLLRTPLPILWKVVKGVARSSLFLSTCIGMAWRGACVAAKVTGTSTWWSIAGSAWVAGLATLLEKKSRRMELSLYAISRAIESFFLCVADTWPIRLARAIAPRRIDVALFSIASAIILHCYSDGNGRHRGLFRSKYLNVLDFILGNEGMEGGAIKHVPSSQDLGKAFMKKMRPSRWVLRGPSMAYAVRPGAAGGGPGGRAGPGMGAADRERLPVPFGPSLGPASARAAAAGSSRMVGVGGSLPDFSLYDDGRGSSGFGGRRGRSRLSAAADLEEVGESDGPGAAGPPLGDLAANGGPGWATRPAGSGRPYEGSADGHGLWQDGLGGNGGGRRNGGLGPGGLGAYHSGDTSATASVDEDSGDGYGHGNGERGGNGNGSAAGHRAT